MVYELNCQYVPDPDVDVLLESGEVISLDEYIRAAVAERQPAYIPGDAIESGHFSVRFPQPQTRQDAIDFVAALKPYISAGKVTGHNCHHDTGGACEMPTLIDAWGEGLEEEGV